jgi:hypothetical protein
MQEKERMVTSAKAQADDDRRHAAATQSALLEAKSVAASLEEMLSKAEVALKKVPC